jgi:hypothetical protein
MDQARQHAAADIVRAEQEFGGSAILPNRWLQQGIAKLFGRGVSRKGAKAQRKTIHGERHLHFHDRASLSDKSKTLRLSAFA